MYCVVSRVVWRKVARENWGKKCVELLVFSSSIVTSFWALLIRSQEGQGKYAFSDLPFWAHMLVETPLFIVCIPCQVQLQLCLGHPSLWNWTTSLYSSPDTCPRFHCLCIYFLPFSLTRSCSPPQPCQSLAFLTWFPTSENREVLQSMEDILKDQPVLFSSLAPEGCSPGVNDYLRGQESPWLSLRIPGILLSLSSASYLYSLSDFCHISQVCDSTSAWSVQPWLPSVLMFPVSLLMLATKWSSISPWMVGFSVTWLQKSSGRLMDCLKLALLLSQWMSGWLKSLVGHESLSIMLPITWARRLYPLNALDQTASSRHYPQGSFCCLGLWFSPPGFQPAHAVLLRWLLILSLLTLRASSPASFLPLLSLLKSL